MRFFKSLAIALLTATLAAPEADADSLGKAFARSALRKVLKLESAGCGEPGQTTGKVTQGMAFYQ